jgi:hypothetical protein
MKKICTITLLALTVFTTGCTTLPEGVGRWEMLFGATDPQREATLVCLRYPDYYENCDEPKIRMLGDTAFGFDQDCKGFTEAVTAMAREWGYDDLSYLFIPSAMKGQAHHVVPVIHVNGKQFVLDNAVSNGRSESIWVGELDEYVAYTGHEYIDIPRPFEGEEARKYDNPVHTLTAVLDANGEFQPKDETYSY